MLDLGALGGVLLLEEVVLVLEERFRRALPYIGVQERRPNDATSAKGGIS